MIGHGKSLKYTIKAWRRIIENSATARHRIQVGLENMSYFFLQKNFYFSTYENFGRDVSQTKRATHSVLYWHLSAPQLQVNSFSFCVQNVSL